MKAQCCLNRAPIAFPGLSETLRPAVPTEVRLDPELEHLVRRNI